MRTLLALTLGIVLGVVCTLGFVGLSGSSTYRILVGWPDIQSAVRDGCEPFEVAQIVYARCPRFRLP